MSYWTSYGYRRLFILIHFILIYIRNSIPKMINRSFVDLFWYIFNRRAIELYAGVDFFVLSRRAGNVLWIRELKARLATPWLKSNVCHIHRDGQWLVIGARAPITLEKVNVTREGFRVGLHNRVRFSPYVTLFRVYPAIEKVQAGQTLSSLLTVCAIEVGSKVNEYSRRRNDPIRENYIFLESNIFSYVKSTHLT